MPLNTQLVGYHFFEKSIPYLDPCVTSLGHLGLFFYHPLYHLSLFIFIQCFSAIYVFIFCPKLKIINLSHLMSPLPFTLAFDLACFVFLLELRMDSFKLNVDLKISIIVSCNCVLSFQCYYEHQLIFVMDWPKLELRNYTRNARFGFNAVFCQHF